MPLKESLKKIDPLWNPFFDPRLDGSASTKVFTEGTLLDRFLEDEKVELIDDLFGKARSFHSTRLFTRYETSGSKASPSPDPLLLEETKKGAFPAATLDRDGDGYNEISRIGLEILIVEGLVKGPVALANYFDDQKFAPGTDHSLKFFLSNHTLRQYLRLATLAASKDLVKASDYFHSLAKNDPNPLKKVQPYLWTYLNRIAVHSGYGVDDRIILEKNQSGFSVTSDGRWRVDCAIFAQLAHAVLKKIDGLEFSYIYLRAQKPPMAHVVMLISDANDHHIVVDNNLATYFEGTDPEDYLIARYTLRGFDIMARGSDRWEPYEKAKRFYPPDSK